MDFRFCSSGAALMSMGDDDHTSQKENSNRHGSIFIDSIKSYVIIISMLQAIDKARGKRNCTFVHKQEKHAQPHCGP